MARPALLLALQIACGAPLGAMAAPPSAFPGRTWTSEEAGVSLDLPAAWEVSEPAPYPTQLVTVTHHAGMRMTLTAQAAGGDDARPLAADAARRLASEGVAVAPPRQRGRAVELAGAAAATARSFRQGWLVHQGRAFVLTMTCPTARLTESERAYARTLASLRFSDRRTSTAR